MTDQHQTVRLAPGKHVGAGRHVCVMELASILAGEPFSDRPPCADPVLGEFLRALNDNVDRDRRQELLPYAAQVVGTAGARGVTRARRRRCLRYATGREDGVRVRWRLLRRYGLRAALAPAEAAGLWAVEAVFDRNDPIVGFDLLDELLDIGRVRGPSTPAALAPPPRSFVLERYGWQEAAIRR